MDEITPEQKEQLNNWSIQRDALLGVIANLKVEEEAGREKIKALAESATDIENKIQQSIGRLTELDNTEKLYIEIVDSKLPDLEKQKTKLQTEITNSMKEIGILSEKKDALTKDILFLITTQEDVFNRTGILEKVVEHVTNVSSANIKELDNAVIEITKKVEKILSLSDVNIKAHIEILNEIPKLFVELSRQTLTRQKI